MLFCQSLIMITMTIGESGTLGLVHVQVYSLSAGCRTGKSSACRPIYAALANYTLYSTL